jgi:hypothetical protein
MERPGLIFFMMVFLVLPGDRPAAGQDSAWGADWLRARTVSVRVYFEAGYPVEAQRLRELEAAVQRIAVDLELTPGQVASLRVRPIEFLYIRDPASLSWFGGQDVDGLALVADRRIVASRLPHEHELVHVLAYIAIAPAPEHNQPWLQEGLASYLGGQLGEAPLAVLATGDRVLDEHRGLIRRLLTATGFRESVLPAASCYSASARFVQYLDEVRGGRGPLMELLRLLAGVEEEVVARPASIIETQLEGVYSTAFGQLLEDFEIWRAENPVAGIALAVPPPRGADLVISDDDHIVHWWIDGSGWTIMATPRADAVELALGWGGPAPARGAWTSPADDSGLELRIDENGGRLIDRGRPRVLLRWYDDQGSRGPDGELIWFIPAAAVGRTPVPAIESRLLLWSQPRFRVD